MRLSALVAAVGLLAVGAMTIPAGAHAQSAFGPPTPPTSQPSAVRGVYDPARYVNSPATIVPAPVIPQVDGNAGENTAPVSLANAQPLEGGEIVARIDGQIVLASDVMWQVNKIIEANRDRIPPDQVDSARQFLLRQQVMGLVDTKLLYADFRRKVPAENIPTIEKNLETPFQEMELPRIMKMLEVEDRRDLPGALQNLGTSLKEMQRQFNERTIAGEWLRQLAPKPKEVTYDELVDYYKEHEAEGTYDQPAQVRWEELMVRFDRMRGDRAAAWRAIAEMGNQVWQRVAANPELRGALFTEVAKQKSHGVTAKQGGAYDWTTKGALRFQKIDEALFSLEVGQLSDIIETEQGFHIVRVLERKDAGRIPFTEAQAKIRKQLENGRKQELIEAELVRLRKESRVWTIFDGDVSGARVAEMLDRPQRR
jgi:PPIC-type PPIASE domain